MGDTREHRDGFPLADDQSATDSRRSLTRRRFVRTSAAVASALAVGSSGTAAGQSVADALDAGEMAAVPNSDRFVVHNNQWGNDAVEQTVYTYDDGSYGWEFGGGGTGITFPEVFVGQYPWGTDTGVPELADVALGELEELVVTFDATAAVECGGEYALALKFGLLDGEPGENPPLTHEIDLVLDWGGGHAASRSPFEERACWVDQFGNTVDYWERFDAGGAAKGAHVFGVRSPATDGTVDLLPLLEYLTDRLGVPGDRRMGAVEFGTRTIDGPTGAVHVSQFDVTVHGATYTSVPRYVGDRDVSAHGVDGSATVDGRTVCDVDGDGHYRDVTGDGSVGQTDVVRFFEVQHRDAWKQPDLFDFSGNGEVGHGDVVALFEHVATA